MLNIGESCEFPWEENVYEREEDVPSNNTETGSRINKPRPEWVVGMKSWRAFFDSDSGEMMDSRAMLRHAWSSRGTSTRSSSRYDTCTIMLNNRRVCSYNKVLVRV